MESTNKMLDAFHAMNVVIQKDPHASEGETLLLKYTAAERAQLCARISHLFHGMSPSLPSDKSPLLNKASVSKLDETRIFPE
jgi:hypothetical protein